MPHPPCKERSPSQNFNPKAKFVVREGSSQGTSPASSAPSRSFSPTSHNSDMNFSEGSVPEGSPSPLQLRTVHTNSSSESSMPSFSSTANTISFVKSGKSVEMYEIDEPVAADENSVDHLLQLFNSPVRSQGPVKQSSLGNSSPPNKYAISTSSAMPSSLSLNHPSSAINVSTLSSNKGQDLYGQPKMSLADVNFDDEEENGDHNEHILPPQEQALRSNSQVPTQSRALSWTTEEGFTNVQSNNSANIPNRTFDDRRTNINGSTSSNGAWINGNGFSNVEGSSSMAPPISNSNVGGTTSTKSKCLRVTIAGPAWTRGIKASAFSRNACDNLRCLKCNFKVMTFLGKSWDESADYIFFRNNVPNEKKLSEKLRNSPESCAYCCQCTWTHLVDEKSVSAGMEFQWACAGH